MFTTYVASANFDFACEWLTTYLPGGSSFFFPLIWKVLKLIKGDFKSEGTGGCLVLKKDPNPYYCIPYSLLMIYSIYSKAQKDTKKDTQREKPTDLQIKGTHSPCSLTSSALICK